MAEKRNSLSLAEGVILFEYAKKNPGVGMRKIAEVFTYGRTHMQGILKTKESITNSFQTQAPTSRKRNCGAKYKDVDAAVFE